MNRPVYTPPEGIPEPVRARMAQKAASLWCAVTPDGASFYLDAERARRFVAKHGGQAFEPIAREEAP